MSDETESGRQRRLRDAVLDLPAQWETNRPGRPPGEQLARHLAALRNRLEWLVQLEDQKGEDQRGVHHNRAERNALIFVLQRYAQEALEEADRPVQSAEPGKTRAQPDGRYVERVLEEVDEAVRLGFVRLSERKPGVLMHRSGEDIAPMEVRLPVWLYMLAKHGIETP